jgi:hypothetical protein
MKPITIEEINEMSPEELEAYKLEAARLLVRRFAMLMLFNVGTTILIHRWARRLRDQ